MDGGAHFQSSSERGMERLNGLVLFACLSTAIGMFAVPAWSDDITLTFNESKIGWLLDQKYDVRLGNVWLCAPYDSPSQKCQGGSVDGSYVSDVISFRQLSAGQQDVIFESDCNTDTCEAGDLADFGKFDGTLDCKVAVCLGENKVNGVERVEYTPEAGQPGYNRNPNGKDVFHYVFYSDTPEPTSIALLATVLVGVICRRWEPGLRLARRVASPAARQQKLPRE